MITVLHNAKQEQLASEHEVRSRLAEGTLAATDLAWHKGLPYWIPVSELLQPSVPSAAAAHTVSVVDFNIPFWRMVTLMVKSAFAAIPAIIIICAVVFVVFFVVAMLFGGVATLIQLLQQHR